MIIDYKRIGLRIKGYRRQTCLTQAKLAELTEMSDTYISRIETGAKKASLGSLAKIALVLEVSLDALVFGESLRNYASRFAYSHEGFCPKGKVHSNRK